MVLNARFRVAVSPGTFTSGGLRLVACLVGFAGIAVAATRSFPDHHRYTRAQAQALCDEAVRDSLVLVTTEKDLARLGGDEEVARLAAQARALPVTLVFEDEERFRSLLLERLARARGQPR